MSREIVGVPPDVDKSVPCGRQPQGVLEPPDAERVEEGRRGARGAQKGRAGHVDGTGDARRPDGRPRSRQRGRVAGVALPETSGALRQRVAGVAPPALPPAIAREAVRGEQVQVRTVDLILGKDERAQGEAMRRGHALGTPEIVSERFSALAGRQREIVRVGMRADLLPWSVAD